MSKCEKYIEISTRRCQFFLTFIIIILATPATPVFVNNHFWFLSSFCTFTDDF